MKKFFNVLFMLTADAAGMTGTITAPVVKIYTSDKLVALKAEWKAKQQGILDKAAANPEYLGSDENVADNLENFKNTNEQAAEIASLKAAEREADVKKQREEKLAIIPAFLSAYDTNNAAQAAFGKLKDAQRTPEAIAESNAANDAFKAAQEKLEAAILGRLAPVTAKPADGSAHAATGEAKGAKSAAILKILTDETASGKTLTEAKKIAVAAGYAVGTVGTVATAHFTA